VVVIARYLPGLRAPTFFTAGHSRLPFWEFALFDGVAALISAPLWVCLGFYFGDDIEQAARQASRFGHYILAGALAVAAGLAFRWLRRRRARAGAGPSQGAPSPLPGPAEGPGPGGAEPPSGEAGRRVAGGKGEAEDHHRVDAV
jgi:hypothetical protein